MIVLRGGIDAKPALV